ncbi:MULTISPECIES: peptide-methionine (R)-S-oxide reductase MsrB [Chromohalobacter]|uniref:peptide-methionine (R)-S-oxide reductase n=1 Tax=Chromohalobacter israelensis (strain ATCC BAA-138 / DSM 3043 / CIP 106854 / NCIMB 13768 / 1H11) TaxID=290398 RepID=Q1QU55_CHRI1|nr:MULTISPECIES: peptide-methionine (R)-S-oxide reductase MsrB [Chromohalobacter]ABE60003.1 Twin-arginine translocation pathway signal [Chromohalobacter salexigens DSM 3043]MBZ5875824.1 peptide-methionine (R)-S-oxide reductase MsrB [Chromohalobacter salexigens]MDF9435329.1 peptide-methionine (R)-S-oxide reductase MsrB [Chromohalobacter israelensis]MDO0945804.1 peptide-methionine (R)-S-oxide reductase MsrB [Chromohalobacter salexigens]NQY44961.1 peptide-methionine (R)-S-oxide reductase MsrB [Ch
MQRRRFLGWLGAAGALGTVPSLVLARPKLSLERGADVEPLTLTDAEWRERLSPERYRILRENGTEPAGSSPLDKETRAGEYRCAGCDLPLFSSRTKYDSGTGWPSFYDHIQGHLLTELDFVLLIPRTEYHCARCGGHQGHVFEDGPAPTGLRWCNNGLALRFVPDATS